MILKSGAEYNLYVLEGRPIRVNGARVPMLGSAMITEETAIDVVSEQDAELLLVDVKK